MAKNDTETITDNAGEYWIDTSAITRSTTKMHRIRWTIENVSQIPLDTNLMGPSFYLTRSCWCNISFEKCREDLFVYLVNKSDKTLKIERSLVLFDCDGKKWHQENMGKEFILETNVDVDIIGGVKQISQFDSLKNDLLIIDCHIKVDGCITTEQSVFKGGRERKENLIKDLMVLFNNPIDSDFTLRVGDEIIYTHKALLRVRSAYFKKLFETEMKESAENFLSITDVSHPTMFRLIEFLYTGDLTETSEDCTMQQISDLYLAADKYEVIDLKGLCSEKFLSIATIDNIYDILILAHSSGDDDLKVRAMNFMYYYLNEIEESDSWKAFKFMESDLAFEVLSFWFQRLKSD